MNRPAAFKVRATMATYTLDAPARRKIRARSQTVVPVVMKSPTSRIPRPLGDEKGLAIRSRHIQQHKPPRIGCICATHTSHTGRGEILIRGARQKWQSEGNSVARKHSAIPLTDEISRCCAAILVPETRIWSPLLLKTSPPRPAALYGHQVDESASV